MKKNAWLAAAWIVLAACTGKAPTDDASAIAHKKFDELTPEIINGLKDEQLEQAVVDNIVATFGKEPRDKHDRIAAMNNGQRAIYLTWLVEAEVDAGGLKNYYEKSGETTSAYVKEAFQTIGDSLYASLMEKANSIWEAHKQQKIKGVDDPWSELEDEIEKLPDAESLDKLKVAYIRGHVDEFVSHKEHFR